MRLRAAMVFLLAFLVRGFFLSSISGQERTEPAKKQNRKTESVYAEIAKAPEKARAKRNVMEKDPEAVAAGRLLYEQRCAECHGNAGEGSRRGPSLRAREVQNAEPGAIFWILTNGVVRRGMPVWSKLPEPQRWQLVSYIKSLGTSTGKLKTFSSATPEPSVTKDLSLPRR
jgi:mono/diheme cytochrome c family protein